MVDCFDTFICDQFTVNYWVVLKLLILFASMEVKDHCIWFSNFHMNIFSFRGILKYLLNISVPMINVNVMSLLSKNSRLLHLVFKLSQIIIG